MSTIDNLISIKFVEEPYFYGDSVSSLVHYGPIGKPEAAVKGLAMCTFLGGGW